MSTDNQEALQEALVQLERAKSRERSLAEENRVILSTISEISKANSISDIFSSLELVLKKYIKFDDFIVLSRLNKKDQFKTILTNNRVYENISWQDSGKLSRVINGECTILFEPRNLPEFSSLNSILVDQINSVLMTGIDTGLTQSVIVFIHSNTKYFSVETKATLNRFRPLIERAVFDIENKEKLEATVRERTAELAVAKERAEESDRLKSAFLAAMSHELRTPLNSIIGFTGIILQELVGPLNNEQSKQLTMVQDSAQHLLSLINDVLDLSKVEAGRLKIDISDVNLKKVLENSMTIVKDVALKNQIQLSLDMDGVPVTIQSDKRKLKQIMYNLLSNAVKFTPDGGFVRVNSKLVDCSIKSGRRSEDPETFQIVIDQKSKNKIPGALYKKCVEIAVSDTGIGIRKEDQKRVFNQFEQIDGSSDKKFQGTGLGLALTKRLVELNGGKIWVESGGEGKGSTFRFIIPT